MKTKSRGPYKGRSGPSKTRSISLPDLEWQWLTSRPEGASGWIVGQVEEERRFERDRVDGEEEDAAQAK